MTGAERGLMLLCCRLSDPKANVLTNAQYHALEGCIRALPRENGERMLTESDLRFMGLAPEMADRIMALLDREAELDTYLARAARYDITPVTRASADYPDVLEEKLGSSAPPVLFCRGETRFFRRRFAALVGSRELTAEGRAFAEQVGQAAAKDGYTLVSGGAHGADRAAQASCLAAGGSVIVFTPENLCEAQENRQMLYVSEGGFEEEFSAARALARNRLIHALADLTFVAQCGAGKGGTWRGTSDNLRRGWSPVFVHDDGSEGARMLADLGAQPVREVTSVEALRPRTLTEWDE